MAFRKCGMFTPLSRAVPGVPQGTDRGVDALSLHLVERFQKVLDDPILEAFSIFDVRKWPADKGVLKESYIDEMRLLYKT